MSYYENVYLPRLNKNGMTRKERTLAIKAQQFEDSYLNKSIYRVEFDVDYVPYIGTLQPVKEKEDIIVYQLLLPIASFIDIGTIVTINEQKWLIVFKPPTVETGYNKYQVYLLDRTLTWWDQNKEIQTSPVEFCGRMDKEIEDIFQKVSGNPSHREISSLAKVIMPFNENLKQDCYAKIDGSDRRFIITGYDSETIPEIMFVTLDITMAREDSEQDQTPNSFWGGA